MRFKKFSSMLALNLTVLSLVSNTAYANNLWDYNLKQFNVQTEYAVPDVAPNVPDYSAKSDLSDVFNISEYTGFSENQKKEIAEKGFLITEPVYKSLKMHQDYEGLEYTATPAFITTDIMLYMYHVFYNNSLMSLEKNTLYDKLNTLTNNVYKISLQLYNNPDYSNLKEELKYTTAYFLVANKLMEIDIQNIPSEIEELANRELELINKSSDYTNSPIFNYNIDYSQYIVRGHYTADKALQNYFKTMMWYGNAGFPILKEDNSLDTQNTIKSMLITYIIFQDEKNLTDWENIYSTTSLYSGNSDDLTILNIRDLIKNVYGSNPNLKDFNNNSYFDKILEQANKLPSPQVIAKINNENSNTKTEKQFRFMGQRFTFDSEIMQNLMEPNNRPVPSGLDVIAAFGNERAEQLIDDYYKPKEYWSDYETELNKLKQKYSNISEDMWKSNLYNGWLWTIKSAAKSFENIDGMPMFMKNKYWSYKNINTALGSFAELKHDNVLYSKQAVAEMGGFRENLPYHYVEPNVEVYSKLLWLTKNTKQNLEIRNLIDEQTAQILDRMIEIQQVILDVSVKELNNTTVTREEFDELSAIGGIIDYLEVTLNAITSIEVPLDNYTSVLVSGVATIDPSNGGEYLELGTGFPYDIYVLCHLNGKTFLAKGTVYNYYEFLSSQRLTDEQWQTLLGIKKVNNDGWEFIDIQEPSADLPNNPEWTDLIISKEKNDIIVEYKDLNWND